MAHPGAFNLIWGFLGDEKLLVLICVATVPLYVGQKLWRSPEINLIGIGVFLGIASYFLQDKGWAYHRMPGWAFATIWLALVIDGALREKKIWATAMAIILSVAVLLMSMALLFAQAESRYPMETVTHMQNDLVKLGVQPEEVQCLDMTAAGCVNVLYRLHLKQATGFIYDFYLFPQRPTALTEKLQRRFLSQISARPPRLIVLSSHIWPPDRFTYDEVAHWPAFDSFLNTNYRIAREYAPPLRDQDIVAGYRIYLLNPQNISAPLYLGSRHVE